MQEISKQLVAEINAGQARPIYFLYGEEPYYIDALSDYIQSKVLTDSEKDFNQTVLYGRDVTIDDIVSHAKRFPMMAPHQVVIVKEAQDLSRHIEKLIDYVKNPQPTTVLVINYKYKTLDKRKALYKALQSKQAVFESKTLYDNQVSDWIRRYLKSQSYTITPKAAQLLVDYLGNNLSKINNEFTKLKLVLPKGTEITPTHIEDHIGISKDYNNFELRKAIGDKDVVKAHRIIKYFGENPKDNPLPVTLSLLYSFFSQLLLYHSLTNKSKRSVSETLRVPEFFVNEYVLAANNYSMKRVSQAISQIRDFDLKSKGVGSNATPPGELLKELVVKVMD